MGNIAPLWIFQALDNNGKIADGARLFSWVAGTTEPTPIFADEPCTTPLENPCTLNSAGRIDMWLRPGIAYRLRLETATGEVLEDRSPVVGSAGISKAVDLIQLVGNSSEIVWNLNEDETQLLGSLVWPLTPPVGGYINAPASIYKSESGGLGHGTDTFTAKDSAGSDSRLGIEFAYSGSETTATIGDLDGTRIDFGENVGGTGVDANGNGLFRFGGLIDDELAGDGDAFASVNFNGRFERKSSDAVRDLMGIHERHENLNVYVNYPVSTSGFILLNNSPEFEIKPNTLKQGSTIEIEAYFYLNAPDYADITFGLSNSTLPQYPGSGSVQSGINIGSDAGNWPTFSQSDIRAKAKIFVGDIMADTTRRVHMYFEIFRYDTNEMISVKRTNYYVESSISLYPHLSVDLSGPGSLTRLAYTSRIFTP